MKIFVFIFAFIIISISITNAQSRWSFELHGGEVYNVPSPLIIKQQGYPDINFSARYRTDPFSLPIYWDWRFCRWQNSKSWEFEVIHHKLYLHNTTPEVQKFNISHGFNMIMLNRGFDKKKFQFRVGGGIVLAHPESKIRGKEFGDTGDDFDLGYFISGPVINAAISRPFYLTNRFYINTEAKTTLAYSKIKLAQGHANVYNFAIHIILGFGIDFIKHGEKE